MTADTVGGVWTYALELARALGSYGVEVALATMGAAPTREQQEEARGVFNLSLFKSEYRLEWMDDPWADVRRAGEWLLHLEGRLRHEVVHLNGYAHAALPWCSPTLVVGHSCVLSWWRAVKSEEAPAEWARYREEVTRGLRAAGAVAAPTRAMLGALEELYGPLPPRARVVPNGRDPRLFAPGRKEEFVLTAGRLWDEAKNVAALERVAPRLRWPVYVAGEADHPGRAAERGRRPGGVRLLGKLPPKSLAMWLSSAAVYALPARYEPFGLSALEAALSGCALVLGDIASLREVWADAAVYVPPGDDEALAAALEELAGDGAQREELARRAGERALLYTPRLMAEGYLAAYAALMGCPDSKEREVAAACAS
jgi:glycosyltransferase involved in cell wall biosynthesis